MSQTDYFTHSNYVSNENKRRKRDVSYVFKNNALQVLNKPYNVPDAPRKSTGSCEIDDSINPVRSLFQDITNAPNAPRKSSGSCDIDETIYCNKVLFEETPRSYGTLVVSYNSAFSPYVRHR